MPTSARTASHRTRRIAAASLASSACAAALLGFAGTASADTPAAPASSQQQSQKSGGSQGRAIVDAAAAQQGDPYEYGADGPDTFDCSGLTQFAHEKAGHDIPRTTDGQHEALPEVPKSEKQPGDVIFIHTSGGDVYHAGIYAGDGEMWAAPESGEDVQLQDIWTSSYSVGRAY